MDRLGQIVTRVEWLRSILLPLVVLTLMALPLAGLNAWLNPHRPVVPGGAVSEYALQLSDLLDELDAVLWVDTRAAHAFQKGHPAGAIHFDPNEVEAGLLALFDAWQPYLRTVVYCDGALCGTSERVAQELRELYAIEGAVFLVGGWGVLQDASVQGHILMEGSLR